MSQEGCQSCPTATSMASLWVSIHFPVGSAQSTQQEGEEQSVSFPSRPALQSGHRPHLPSLHFHPQPGPLALLGILRHCQVGLFHQGHWARERVPSFARSSLLLLGIDALWRSGLRPRRVKVPLATSRGLRPGSGGGLWHHAHLSGILECKFHEGKIFVCFTHY